MESGCGQLTITIKKNPPPFLAIRPCNLTLFSVKKLTGLNYYPCSMYSTTFHPHLLIRMTLKNTKQQTIQSANCPKSISNSTIFWHSFIFSRTD